MTPTFSGEIQLAGWSESHTGWHKINFASKPYKHWWTSYIFRSKSVKISEPEKQWNAIRALSNSSLKRNDSMPDLILTPGRACAKCGAIDRYPGGNCKPCAKARSAAWTKANPEQNKANCKARYNADPARARARNKAWAQANPKKTKEIAEAWIKANPGRNAERARAWAKENPEARRVQHQNRKAKIRFNGGSLSKGLVEKLLKLQKGMCPCCQQPLGDDYHLDHVMPLALGGLHADGNMQLLRARCNMQKKAKHPVEFMQDRGFLL